ncbi:MAG: SGNH/GDSL hydrolase family protein [Candidatus Micrarchaeota archaeon]
MAKVEIVNGYIVFKAQGSTYNSPIAVSKGMAWADLERRIKQARNIVAMGMLQKNPKLAREISTATYGHLRSYASARRPEPRRTISAPSRPAAARRGAGPKGPAITPAWIESRIKEASRDSRARSARTLHESSLYVQAYLSAARPAGIDRSEKQAAATYAVFDALWKIPRFRLRLATMAYDEWTEKDKSKRRLWELVDLNAFVQGKGSLSAIRGSSLAPKEKADVMRGADMFIRYFLYGIVATDPHFSLFRKELGKIKDAGYALGNIQRNLTGADKLGLLRTQLTLPINADMITLSSLFIRRWTLEKESGIPQGRISEWNAPAPIPLPGTSTQAVPSKIPAPGLKAPTIKPMRIGVIGDSITSLTTSRTYILPLRVLLDKTAPGSKVDQYGRSGQTILQIQARFQKDILSRRYDVVIIQGGVNKAESIPYRTAQKAFADMLKEALRRSDKVVVLTITPCSTNKNLSEENAKLAQANIQRINTWLLSLPARVKGLTVVDTSPLGEPGRLGPKLKPIYDYRDGLHLSERGHAKLAELIATALGAQAAPVTAKTALQLFADKNWKNLDAMLFGAVKTGNPVLLVKIASDLDIPGVRVKPASLEDALRALGRRDIESAFAKAFEHLKDDATFMFFCGSRYSGIRRSVQLSPDNSPQSNRNRLYVATAVQAYLNHTASQNAKLGGDLRMLYRDTLGMKQDSLPINGLADMRLLSALAVYQWRITKSNREKAVGAWKGPGLSTPQRIPPDRRVPPRQVEGDRALPI